jgi:hypothetical protein
MKHRLTWVLSLTLIISATPMIAHGKAKKVVRVTAAKAVQSAPTTTALAPVALPIPFIGASPARTATPVVVVSTPVTTVVPAPVTASISPMQVGVNLAPLSPHSDQRVYGNMANTGRWRSAGNTAWQFMPETQLSPLGAVKFLLPGQIAPLFLSLPAGPYTTIPISCRFDGVGKLAGYGALSFKGQYQNRADFDVTWSNISRSGYIQITETSPNNPLRNIDCREKTMAADVFFDPAFKKSLTGFRVIRFLDWQQVNANKGGNWAGFVPDGHQMRTSEPEGARPDDMIRLANETNSDPWFSMPFTADDIYIRNFAELAKKNLKPGLKVYVELGNELWNYNNPATHQAAQEGKALALSTNDHQAMLRRYSQKSRNALKIWTEVFKGEEARLVRVVATQNVSPDSAKIVLSFEDTTKYVDALATAPYFYAKTENYSIATLDGLFKEIDVSMKAAIDYAAQNKAIANSYGKRYIAYEGGQHLVIKDMAYATAVQRDPRMGLAYNNYLKLWQSKVGDLIVLYSHTGGIGGSGAWGLREYADQPTKETPKWTAVQGFLN